MSTPPLADELAQQAIDLVAKHGNVRLASQATGMNYHMLEKRWTIARTRGLAPTYIKPDFSDAKGKRVLVIPDLHMPFQHPDAFDFLEAAKKSYTPHMVICLGDETDNHALSQYDPDPDGYSAGHELEMAKEEAQTLYRMFPLMSLCESNHGVRAFKKAYRAGIPSAFLRDYREYMGSPKGWHWYSQLEVDGVIYKHGDGYSGKDASLNAAKDNMKPTVIGHIHAFAGVQYYNNGDVQIWGMNCGCLADVKSYAMKYGQHARAKPVMACGVVDKGHPFLISMRLDKHKRWTGEL